MNNLNAMAAKIETKKRRDLVDEAKVNREYEKVITHQKQQEEVGKSTLAALRASKDSNHAKRLITEIIKNKELIKLSVPFISTKLGSMVPQVPGQITMLGAQSGTGKTTNVAAIAHRNFRLGKRTLVICNEESETNFMVRVACAETGIDFSSFIRGLSSKLEDKLVAKAIASMVDYIDVIDNSIATTTAEYVVDRLKEADESGVYAIAVIDFLQRITRSSVNPMAEKTAVLYMFKDLLTDYTLTAKLPVIVMAQLKPIDVEEQDRQLQQRIGWCSGFYEVCANVLEAIRMDGIDVTMYHVQKGRWTGSKKLWIPHEFIGGQFVAIDKTRLADLKTANKARMITEKMDDLQANIAATTGAEDVAIANKENAV